MKFLKMLLIIILPLMFLACSNDSRPVRQAADEDVSSNNPPANNKSWVQIERLARPAVNEGLLVTNDYLNAFNSIPPTLDLATNNPAVLSVLQEASAFLDAYDTLDGVEQFDNGFDNQVVAGFLPDVMRIDTSVSIAVGTPAYNADVGLISYTKSDGSTDQGAILTGGRKIEDDVVDITLSYLVAGDPSGNSVKDNVSYAGEPGNPATGHSLLEGQASANGAASFPFLARPR